jgi:hypothetical protein
MENQMHIDAPMQENTLAHLYLEADIACRNLSEKILKGDCLDREIAS